MDIQNLDILVKDNIRTLTLPTKRFAKPVAIIFVGTPFSGKTTSVNYLIQEFPLALLSEVNMASFLAPKATFFRRGTEEIFSLASKTIEELIKQGISCIYDASIKKRSDRVALKQLVEGANGKLFLVHIELPDKQAFERLKTVNSQIVGGVHKGFIMDHDLLNYELRTIERPTEEEHPILCSALDRLAPEKIADQIRPFLKE